MVKILTTSGDSLADIYDVEGSIAGIDQLHTRELPIVHEMGSTIFSERFTTAIHRVASGDVAQSTNIFLVITNMPVMVTRLLSIAVITDDPTRLERAVVLARDPRPSVAGMECPIWQWDETNFTSLDMIDFGDATPTRYQLLRGTSEATFVPNFTGGSGQQPDMVSEIAFNSRTTAFGAGTVFVRLLLHVASARAHRAGSGVSSRGLAIPSW